MQEHRYGGDHHQHRHGDGGLGVLQHEAAGRLVDAVEEDADGVLLLGVVLPDEHVGAQLRQPLGFEGEGVHAREEHAQGRIQGDSQDRGDGHGQVLGVGQRSEEAALLVHQREHGHEGDGDDQQREEDRRPHFQQGFQAHVVEVAGAPRAVPGLQFLVGVLHLHDGSVHEHADADGDPGEGHEVGVLPQAQHGNEGQGHGDGDRHDGHDGRGHVPEENEDHEGNDDHLLDELVLHRVDGPFDELGAVVDRHHLDPFGQ